MLRGYATLRRTKLDDPLLQILWGGKWFLYFLYAEHAPAHTLYKHYTNELKNGWVICCHAKLLRVSGVSNIWNAICPIHFKLGTHIPNAII